MGFFPNNSLPDLPEIPDSVPLQDFMFNEKNGRCPISESADSYICAYGSRRVTAQQQAQHVEWLARSLARRLGWKVNVGCEFDKVAAIFAINTIDTMTVSWAIHRLNGVSTPANAAYSVDELHHQIVTSGASVLFTVDSLLSTALSAAKKANLPSSRIFILQTSGAASIDGRGFVKFEDLILEGQDLEPLEPVQWSAGQGARQCAFLCYSSGTSGLPKAVMISHQNVIANILQIKSFESAKRRDWGSEVRDIALGLLPQSHIYSLIIICHMSTYLGDSVVVMAKFNLDQLLEAVSNHRISTLYLVPPVIISMINNLDRLGLHDLSSVQEIYSGAAPLSKEVSERLLARFPTWKVRQAYGMTETCVVVTATSSSDIWLGSSGILLPGFEIKLVRPDGTEIQGYGEPGEVLVKSPSVVLGYLNNSVATDETFVQLPEGRFIRTGDEGEIRISPSGNQHLLITDRIKELIKVKGHQVAPAELEACLLSHSAVADCAVIAVQDQFGGEHPKAFVVKAPNAQGDPTESILNLVETQKARYKWITGGFEYVDIIPKSPSGKILRRLLREQEKIRQRQLQARI